MHKILIITLLAIMGTQLSQAAEEPPEHVTLSSLNSVEDLARTFQNMTLSPRKNAAHFARQLAQTNLPLKHKLTCFVTRHMHASPEEFIKGTMILAGAKHDKISLVDREFFKRVLTPSQDQSISPTQLTEQTTKSILEKWHLGTLLHLQRFTKSHSLLLFNKHISKKDFLTKKARELWAPFLRHDWDWKWGSKLIGGCWAKFAIFKHSWEHGAAGWLYVVSRSTCEDLWQSLLTDVSNPSALDVQYIQSLRDLLCMDRTIGRKRVVQKQIQFIGLTHDISTTWRRVRNTLLSILELERPTILKPYHELALTSQSHDVIASQVYAALKTMNNAQGMPLRARLSCFSQCIQNTQNLIERLRLCLTICFNGAHFVKNDALEDVALNRIANTDDDFKQCFLSLKTPQHIKDVTNIEAHCLRLSRAIFLPYGQGILTTHWARLLYLTNELRLLYQNHSRGIRALYERVADNDDAAKYIKCIRCMLKLPISDHTTWTEYLLKLSDIAHHMIQHIEHIQSAMIYEIPHYQIAISKFFAAAAFPNMQNTFEAIWEEGSLTVLINTLSMKKDNFESKTSYIFPSQGELISWSALVFSSQFCNEQVLQLTLTLFLNYAQILPNFFANEHNLNEPLFQLMIDDAHFTQMPQHPTDQNITKSLEVMEVYCQHCQSRPPYNQAFWDLASRHSNLLTAPQNVSAPILQQAHILLRQYLTTYEWGDGGIITGFIMQYCTILSLMRKAGSTLLPHLFNVPQEHLDHWQSDQAILNAIQYLQLTNQIIFSQDIPYKQYQDICSITEAIVRPMTTLSRAIKLSTKHIAFFANEI